MGGYKCAGISRDPSKLGDISETAAEDKCPPGFQLGVDEECEGIVITMYQEIMLNVTTVVTYLITQKRDF